MSHRRRLTTILAVVTALAFVRPAAAHTGTTHAGTPHWLLAGLVAVGFVGIVVGWRRLARNGVGNRVGSVALVGGLLAVIVGGIGLVEIQVTPQVAPSWASSGELVTIVAASALAVGSLPVVRWRWPERPRYVALAFVLAVWIAYPVVLPNGGLTNPLGYVVVFAVPVTIVYVFARDGGNRLVRALSDRISRLVAASAFLLFSIFFAVSAGTVSFNPDVTARTAGEAFVRLHPVASPLVYWPAAEFHFPSIPVSGYVSVGSALLIAVLGGLVALNAGLVTRQWQAGGDPDSDGAVLGAVASSGATACCCCAPAFYAVAGSVFGTAASPVYWAFLDPTSPVGGLFLAASVLLLVGSAIRFVDTDTCQIPSA
ncbi:hypothetical protein [Salinibaculum rarum]|uniref:hypothetical protein n=1 Tax=Salinibaculum rarum TaxID=3058903 RepID=UPI00265FE526|nr:hypothetical protein [Salinibaculum sp. KK48]